MSQPYKYFAFISYSRKDSRTAAWLQKRLEWFRLPVNLVPDDRRPGKSPYIRPIYRDKTNLEVTDEHYWKNIRRALEESRFLIVLCSPNSAASKPVEMEVAHFMATHDDNLSQLVPIIVSGSVTGSGENAAFGPTLMLHRKTLISRNLPTMVNEEAFNQQDAWEQGFIALVSYLLSLDRTAIGDHIQRETRRQARVLRRWLIAVIALALTTFVGGVIAYQQKQAADSQTARALIGEQAARESEQRANDALEGAETLIDFMTTDLTKKLKPIGRLELMRDVNASVERYHERFARDNDSPQQAHLRALFWYNRGNTLVAEHHLREAVDTFQQGQTILRALISRDPSQEYFQNSLAMSCLSLARTQNLLGEHEASLAASQEAMKILNDLTQQDKPTIRSDWILNLSSAHGTLGDVYRAQEKFDEALTEFRSARSVINFLVQREPDSATLQYQLAMSGERLGDMLLERKEYDEALEEYRSSKDILTTLLKTDFRNTFWKNGLRILIGKIAESQHERGQLDAALTSYEEALALATELALHDEENAIWKRQLALTQSELADVLAAKKQTVAAFAGYRKSALIFQKLFEQEPLDSQALNDLCLNHLNMDAAVSCEKDYAVAIHSLEQNVALFEKMIEQDRQYPPWQRSVAFFYLELGSLLKRGKEWAKAADTFQKVIDISRFHVEKTNFEPAWANNYARAAGTRWEIMRNAPAGTVSLQRAQIIADMQYSQKALRILRRHGKLDPDGEVNLGLLERAFREDEQ